MAKFAYNNVINTSTGHISFKLNCDYYPLVFYEEDINFTSKSKSVEELSTKLRELMTIYWENLYYA